MVDRTRRGPLFQAAPVGTSTQRHIKSHDLTLKKDTLGWPAIPSFASKISNITPLIKVAVFIPAVYYLHPYENLLGRKNLLHYTFSEKSSSGKILSVTYSRLTLHKK